VKTFDIEPFTESIVKEVDGFYYLGRNKYDETLTPIERLLWEEYIKLCVNRSRAIIYYGS
jgi:hypothetical protein